MLFKVVNDLIFVSYFYLSYSIRYLVILFSPLSFVLEMESFNYNLEKNC